MLIMAIISDTCCFISNIEICVLISRLLLVSISGSTVLVAGQNCDKLGRNFCKGCCIKLPGLPCNLQNNEVAFMQLEFCASQFPAFLASGCLLLFECGVLDGWLLCAEGSWQVLMGCCWCLLHWASIPFPHGEHHLSVPFLT